MAADFEDDFFDFDVDDAGRLADAVPEALAEEAGALETELLESAVGDGDGASGSSASFVAASAEASGFAAASELLLETASEALASPEPPVRESFVPATAGEIARATASIHPKNNRIRSSVRI